LLPAGNESEISDVHLLNAFSPMSVQAGNITDVNDVQLANAFFFNAVTASKRAPELSALAIAVIPELLNASSPIIVAFLKSISDNVVHLYANFDGTSPLKFFIFNPASDEHLVKLFVPFMLVTSLSVSVLPRFLQL
jgi:hypothetical protein